MLPKISIVIPVKNGMDTLPKTIAGIQKQTLFLQCEVVVIDSGSTDGSVEFLSQFPYIRVIPIDPKTFNHGATRNFGVQNAKGEYVVMTVQDASAIDEVWLETMLNNFDDPEVAAVCGQQVVPHDDDKNPHEWFRPQSEPKPRSVHFQNPKDFLSLSPQQQRQNCGWDDVNAMYRKEILLQEPFQPLMFGEDMLWAKMALEKGYKIIYDNTAKVSHYHYQFPDYTYKRTLITKFFIYRCFQYIDDRTYTLKSYALVLYRTIKWRSPIKWIWHNYKIIYNHRKATADFIAHVKNDTLESLERELAVKIPMGQQKSKNQ
ncbi:MAG: glycosyltransferase family 2 protein [Gelidibacter sp.]